MRRLVFVREKWARNYQQEISVRMHYRIENTYRVSVVVPQSSVSFLFLDVIFSYFAITSTLVILIYSVQFGKIVFFT